MLFPCVTVGALSPLLCGMSYRCSMKGGLSTPSFIFREEPFSVEESAEREDAKVRESESVPEEEGWVEWSLMEERNG